MDAPTPEDRRADGKQARAKRPRSEIGRWEPAPDRPDPLDILEGQARTRVPELVPIRYGRMAASPFAFYRGAAAVMAADLGVAETSGLDAQLCGDAHLANFGGFAAPDRHLVFDLNDFDETHRGPFEWDLQRLVASIEIAGREMGLPGPECRKATARTARSYRRAMTELADVTDLDVWQRRLTVEGMEALIGPEVGAQVIASLRKAAEKAQRKDRFKALNRLTTLVDGRRQFVSDPPLLVPLHELLGDDAADDFTDVVRSLLDSYRATIARPYGALLDRYHYVHTARKVVGVGSVGTRAWVILLLGRDDQDPLLLQMKEAQASVLEAWTAPSPYAHHGERVVRGQALMQAATDPFLGWERVVGNDGVARDYYLRQLWDWKASADLTSMSPTVLGAYGEICAWTLARAHARTGDRIAIAGYIGNSDTFDRALTDFAVTYADQTGRDHAALTAAIDAGRLTADRER